MSEQPFAIHLVHFPFTRGVHYGKYSFGKNLTPTMVQFLVNTPQVFSLSGQRKMVQPFLGAPNFQ